MYIHETYTHKMYPLQNAHSQNKYLRVLNIYSQNIYSL
jgi:hypothetical protein